MCNGTQGHELLSAFGKFFQELADPNGDIAVNGGVKLVASGKHEGGLTVKILVIILNAYR